MSGIVTKYQLFILLSDKWHIEVGIISFIALVMKPNYSIFYHYSSSGFFIGSSLFLSEIDIRYGL